MGGQPPDRLGRLEVLGAWLGLWTPPRDAVVPPVPWKAIVIGAVVLVVVVGAAAALFLPGVADDRQAAPRARAARRRRAARRDAGVGRPRAAPAARARASRPRRRRRRTRGGPRRARALLASAESRIGVDAHARTGRRIRGVDCEPFPRTARRRRSGRGSRARAAAYNCVAVTARFESGASDDRQGHHRDPVPAGRAFHSRELHLVPDRPARGSRPARSSAAARVSPG